MENLGLLKGIKKSKVSKVSQIGEEEFTAVDHVLKSRILSGFIGRAGKGFLGGKYVRALENDFKKKFGVDYAVSFNSASTALQASLAAVGISPGDEVITSPYTMSATASAILLNGALPVFSDVSPKTYCLDPKRLISNISKNTRAIIFVNLFGSAGDLEKIRQIAKRYRLWLIEDNAQGAGARLGRRFLGTIGDIGIFSLNVHKIIQSGEGGILVTKNKELAFRSQLVRNHGEAVIDDLSKKGIFEPIVGSNYRLSEMQAAIASVQLKKLSTLISYREKMANYLTRKLKLFKWLSPYKLQTNCKGAYYLYPICFHKEKIEIKRSTFSKAMEFEGYPVAEGYQKPLYLLPVYQKRRMYKNSDFPFSLNQNISYERGCCPVAENLYFNDLLTTNIIVPPYNESDIDNFIAALRLIEKNIQLLKNYEKTNL